MYPVTGPTMKALFGSGIRTVFMVGPKRDHPAGERRLIKFRYSSFVACTTLGSLASKALGPPAGARRFSPPPAPSGSCTDIYRLASPTFDMGMGRVRGDQQGNAVLVASQSKLDNAMLAAPPLKPYRSGND